MQFAVPATFDRRWAQAGAAIDLGCHRSVATPMAQQCV